jgi:proline iminopeptidase
VPLDYDAPERGHTKIYAYFAQPYDPSRPTFVFFTGGPGQHSHLKSRAEFAFFENLGFNLLLFDQRGIAFSRMKNEAEARDARNFSSEATARDALAILDSLHISKASIYGTSYGTVPATIFGHLFPKRTTAIVLDGVVFNGWLGVAAGHTLPNLIQAFIDDLPKETRAKMVAAIDSYQLDPGMIPSLVQASMQGAGALGLSTLRKMLIEVFNESAPTSESIWYGLATRAPNPEIEFAASLTPELRERVQKWHSLIGAADPAHQVMDSGDVSRLLMVKEFDAGNARAAFMTTMRNGKIVRQEGTNYAGYMPAFTNLKPWSYSADQFPVSVPIFYIQGTHDGATAAPGATLHYKHVAKGRSQILVFRGHGHLPIQSLLRSSGDSKNWPILGSMFASLLRGEPIGPDLKSSLEKQFPAMKLASALKGFAPTCSSLF